MLYPAPTDHSSDRTSLPPDAHESHIHLAHAVVRYLGLTAPEELSAFGISNAADIVDFVSRVRHSRICVYGNIG